MEKKKRKNKYNKRSVNKFLFKDFNFKFNEVTNS